MGGRRAKYNAPPRSGDERRVWGGAGAGVAGAADDGVRPAVAVPSDPSAAAPYRSTAALSIPLARARRLLTVPIGSSSVAAISS